MAPRTPGTWRTTAATRSASSMPAAPVWKMTTWGLAEMMRSRIPSWNPVITAWTMMSAATPRKTLPTPIQANSERFARWPREPR